MIGSKAYIWGLVVGIAVGLLVLAVIYFISKKRFGGRDCGFDERQEAMRGRAFKAAYLTLLLYCLGCGFFDAVTHIVWADLFTELMIGFIASFMVFAISSIKNDAYVQVGQRMGLYIVMFGAIALMNLGIGIVNLLEGSAKLLTNGALNFHVINLFMGAAFAVISLAMLVKVQRSKREGDVE